MRKIVLAGRSEKARIVYRSDVVYRHAATVLHDGEFTQMGEERLYLVGNTNA